MKITVEYAKEVLEKIDSTLLRPDAVSADVEKLCHDASTAEFKAVCVNPVNIASAKAILKETQVKVCAVIGFPLGEDMTAVKVFQAKKALKAGADELDVVMCISAAKMGRWDYVGKEIKKITKLAKKAVVKVVIETCYLTETEIKQACEAAVRNGARFVKSSTGYGPTGAKVEDIELMHETVTEVLKTFKDDTARCEIKASGGIKTYEQARAFVEAGATRIGTSNAIDILEQSSLQQKPKEKRPTDESVKKAESKDEEAAEEEAEDEEVFSELK